MIYQNKIFFEELKKRLNKDLISISESRSYRDYNIFQIITPYCKINAEFDYDASKITIVSIDNLHTYMHIEFDFNIIRPNSALLRDIVYTVRKIKENMK